MTEIVPGVVPAGGWTESQAVVVLAVNAPALADATETVCAARFEDGDVAVKLSCAGVNVMPPLAPIVSVTATVWLAGLGPDGANDIVPL